MRKQGLVGTSQEGEEKTVDSVAWHTQGKYTAKLFSETILSFFFFFFFSRRDISKWSGTKGSPSMTYNHCMESILAAENRRWLEPVHKWPYLPALKLTGLSFVSYSLVLF